MEPWYATRQQVMRALDVQPSGRTAMQIDRALASASRHADRVCHRRFYPEQRTMTFDWPNDQYAEAWRIWLDANELVSVTTVTAGGTDITSSVLLRPDDGPPYSLLEINRSTSASWGGGTTPQRSVSVVGVYAGCRLDETSVATAAEAMDTSEDGLDVDDSSQVGVGSVLRVDSERMIVTRMGLLDTGQTLAADLTAQKNATTVTVQDGTVFHVDEEITVGAERMRISDIAGNDLLVDRSEAGFGALASHVTGALIFAPRTLVVERGALGTTAAAHSTAATVYRFDPPPLVRDFTIADAIDQVMQEQAGYARTSGSGDNQAEVSGRGVASKRQALYLAHGRKARMRAV